MKLRNPSYKIRSCNIWPGLDLI